MRKIVQKELAGERGRDARDRLRRRRRRAGGVGGRLDLAGGRPARDGARARTSARRRRSTASGSNIGSDLRRKIVNDAAASLRGLASTHGRNAAWADKAVRVASNLTAAEALKMNVIDTIAPSLPALLDKVDGWKTVPPGHIAPHDERRDRRDEPRLPDPASSRRSSTRTCSRCSSSPGSSGSGSRSSTRASCCPARSARSRSSSRSSGSRSCRSSWTGLGLVLLGVAAARDRHLRPVATAR